MSIAENRYANQQNITVPQGESFQASSGNLQRRALYVQNKSGGSIYISFGAPVTYSVTVGYSGIEIPPFTMFTMDENCTTDPVQLRGDNILVGNDCVYTEVTI